MAKEIVNPLGITETWVDAIGTIELKGDQIVRIPFYVVRGELWQFQAFLAMTRLTFAAWIRSSHFMPSPQAASRLPPNFDA